MTQTMSLSYKQWHAGLFSKDNEQRGFWEPVTLYKFEGVMEYGPEAFWSNVSFLCGFKRKIYQFSKYDVKELEVRNFFFPLIW